MMLAAVWFISSFACALCMYGSRTPRGRKITVFLNGGLGDLNIAPRCAPAGDLFLFQPDGTDTIQGGEAEIYRNCVLYDAVIIHSQVINIYVNHISHHETHGSNLLRSRSCMSRSLRGCDGSHCVLHPAEPLGQQHGSTLDMSSVTIQLLTDTKPGLVGSSHTLTLSDERCGVRCGRGVKVNTVRAAITVDQVSLGRLGCGGAYAGPLPWVLTAVAEEDVGRGIGDVRRACIDSMHTKRMAVIADCCRKSSAYQSLS